VIVRCAFNSVRRLYRLGGRPDDPKLLQAVSKPKAVGRVEQAKVAA